MICPECGQADVHAIQAGGEARLWVCASAGCGWRGSEAPAEPAPTLAPVAVVEVGEAPDQKLLDAVAEVALVARCTAEGRLVTIVLDGEWPRTEGRYETFCDVIAQILGAGFEGPMVPVLFDLEHAV